jgi:hypothetical protein
MAYSFLFCLVGNANNAAAARQCALTATQSQNIF